MDAGGLCVDDLGRLELAAAADAPGRVAATPVPPAVGIVAEAFGREGAVPVVAAVVAVSAVAELPAVPAKVAVPVVLVAGRTSLGEALRLAAAVAVVLGRVRFPGARPRGVRGDCRVVHEEVRSAGAVIRDLRSWQKLARVAGFSPTRKLWHASA